MYEIGIVTAINKRRKTAKVEFPRQSSCDKCGMCARHKNNMTVYMDVKNDIGAVIGDKVKVTMAEHFLLKATFIVYVIPIILVGLVLIFARKLDELIQFGISIGVLVIGVVIAAILDKKLKTKKGFSPVMDFVASESKENDKETTIDSNNESCAKTENDCEISDTIQTKERNDKE